MAVVLLVPDYEVGEAGASRLADIENLESQVERELRFVSSGRIRSKRRIMVDTEDPGSQLLHREVAIQHPHHSRAENAL